MFRAFSATAFVMMFDNFTGKRKVNAHKKATAENCCFFVLSIGFIYKCVLHMPSRRNRLILLFRRQDLRYNMLRNPF